MAPLVTGVSKNIWGFETLCNKMTILQGHLFIIPGGVLSLVKRGCFWFILARLPLTIWMSQNAKSVLDDHASDFSLAPDGRWLYCECMCLCMNLFLSIALLQNLVGCLAVYCLHRQLPSKPAS